MIIKEKDRVVELPEVMQEDMIPQAENEENSPTEPAEEDGDFQNPGKENECEAQDRSAEREEVSQYEEAERDTANIEQTEGDSDV